MTDALGARYSLGIRYLSGLYTAFAVLVVGLAMFAALVFGVVDDCAPYEDPHSAPAFARDGLVKEPATYPTIFAGDRCDRGWSPKVDWLPVLPAMEPNS
jgi:hypothetical protein